MYEYYCLGCGKKLSQQSVLFDMQYVLTRDKNKKFQVLSLFMTEEEVKALLNTGTQDEDLFYQCTLNMAQVMQYMSNPYNLNCPEAAQLTMEDLKAYIAYTEQAPKDQTIEEKKETSSLASLFSDAPEEDEQWDEPQNAEETELKPEEETEPYEKPAAIVAIEGSDEANIHEVSTMKHLVDDFKIIQGLFAIEEEVSLRIKPEYDEDNKGNKLLVGYALEQKIGGFIPVEARFCPKCKAPIFTHAGTAEHEIIGFCGDTKAGKTSTLVALAHYAENRATLDLGEYGGVNSKIWEHSKMLDTVETIEILEKREQFTTDLRNYSKGIAPAKTKDQDRLDAYSVTFRVKNKISPQYHLVTPQYHLVTLADLPGELFVTDGKIDAAKIKNTFPYALSSKAFVACFDTSSATDHAAAMIQNVCKWTNAIQKFRAEEQHVENYVPTILLFTKCRELEEAKKTPLPAAVMLPIQKVFKMWDELQAIKANQLYKNVYDKFNTFDKLSMAYHAMLRCSPFGYAAPAAEQQTPEQQAKTPEPQNIDKLMEWILGITGCIPVKGEFEPHKGHGVLSFPDYCIKRPQLRSDKPLRGEDIQEALARCALFENPGTFDRDILENYDQKWALLWVRLKAKWKKSSNVN